MRVVVAEKPSVARDLARVLGATKKQEGYLEGAGLRITWCRGHMAELEEPAHYDPAWRRWSPETLPMVPEAFALRLRQGAREQFDVIRRLLRDRATEDVVNACDAGREGELIFRYVYELAGCARPVLRLWVSSLTDAAIRDGWARLAPASGYDRLADAARSRAEADWLVGLNATRALTCRARDAGAEDLLSVGRVQTPTLAMIVARDRAIAAFVPETFWQVHATFRPDPARSGPPTFEATFFRPELAGAEAERPEGEADEAEVAHAERLGSAEAAESVAAAVRDRLGRVELAERRRTRERPPLLYDLTSLQRRADQRYGMSAQRTLEVAQALYERHKLLTYPRTDARYLTPDQVPGLPAIVAGLQPVPPYASFAAALLAAPIRPGPRVVNAAEVGDHHAILPTGRTPSTLDLDEKRIFDLVARRFLAALSEDALFDVTRLVVAVDPGPAPLPEGLTAPLRFRARGRICRQEGWRAVDPPGRSKDTDLPGVEVGDPARTEAARAAEGRTRPPRPHSDGTLLRAMETAGKALDDEALARALRGRGLGTPATRAAILQTLLDRGYVIRQGRELHATDKGRALIDAVPVDALKNAELTADWEGRLSDMAEGRGPARAAFMEAVVEHLRRIVEAIGAAPLPALEATERASLGACPACGRPVRERGRRFACDGGRECGFVVFGTMAKRAISARMVKQLLAEGRTAPVKGFRSKAGKEFSAGLRWDPEERRVGFWFPDDRPAAEPPAARPLPAPAIAPGATCPTCGAGTVIRGRAALGCSRWRAGCGFRAPLPDGVPPGPDVG